MHYSLTALCIPTSLVLSTGRVRRRIDHPSVERLATYLACWQRPSLRRVITWLRPGLRRGGEVAA